MCVFMHVCILPLSIYIIIIIFIVAVVAVALFDRAMKTYFCRYNIPVVKFNIYISTIMPIEWPAQLRQSAVTFRKGCGQK